MGRVLLDYQCLFRDEIFCSKVTMSRGKRAIYGQTLTKEQNHANRS